MGELAIRRWGRRRGAADETAGRLRRRRRTLASVVALALLAGLLVSGSPPVSAEDSDDGFATMTAYASPQVSVFGDTITVSGRMYDESTSCFVFSDCDEPEGKLTITLVRGPGDTTVLGTTPLNPDPDLDRSSTFEAKVGNLQVGGPPYAYFQVDYTDGNFDDTTALTNEVAATKVPCTVQLTQSSAFSKPGAPVTFTADLGTRAVYAGRTVTFTDAGDSTVWGTGTIAHSSSTGRSTASFTTSGLPQGPTQIYASTAGDGNFDACTTPSVEHKVQTDTPPTAVNDSASTKMNSPVIFNILANDSDDNGISHAEITNQPENGEADFDDETGQVIYTPEQDFAGDDGFDYIVYDGIGQGSQARVSIYVECDEAPEDDAFAVSTRPFTAPPYALLDNDFSCDISTPEIRNQPEHGTVTLGASGSFTYTVDDEGYTGTDSFDYGFEDDDSEATVTLSVDVPAAPTTTTTSTTTSTTSTTAPTTTTTTAPTTTTTAPTTTTTMAPTTTTTTAPTTTTTMAPTTTTTTTTTAPTTTTTTAPPPVLTVAEEQVTSWYESLLGRTPDPGGLDHWAGKLDAGTRPLVVTRQLVGSGEFGRRIVRGAYRTCLGRNPDPGGLAYWSNRIAKGASVDDLRVGLLASNEAWVDAGSDRSAWAGQVYDALVGRFPKSAERAAVVEQLRSGRSRTAVARGIATTPEARRHIAATWYREILGRAPTAAEASDWAEDMAVGTPERILVAELATQLVTAGG